MHQKISNDWHIGERKKTLRILKKIVMKRIEMKRDTHKMKTKINI